MLSNAACGRLAPFRSRIALRYSALLQTGVKTWLPTFRQELVHTRWQVTGIRGGRAAFTTSLRAIPPFSGTGFRRGFASFATSAISASSGSPFVRHAWIFGGATALGFVISVTTGSHLHLDLIGTGVFAVAALVGGAESVVSRALIFLWSSRLAVFLFYRACITGHDSRLEKLLSTAWGAAVFWAISLEWNIVCILPHTLAMAGVARSLWWQRACTPLGISMFAVGWAIECLADVQKWQFKNDDQNKGRICNEGLWSVSQHPNYFGNLLLWSGITVVNIPALLGPAWSASPNLWNARRLILSMACPVFLGALFYGQSAGSLGEAKKQQDDRYGMDVSYQQYVSTVPLLVPSPSALAHELFTSLRAMVGL